MALLDYPPSAMDLDSSAQNGDSLKHLIELAKRLLPWQLKDVLEDAQRVREAARQAVHVTCPAENECRGMFLLTRTS
jgi:hypothetical protein